MQRVGRGQLLTLGMIPSMTRTHYLSGSMVLPGVELLYISPQLITGGRIWMRKRLNTCFKANERSAGRRQYIFVQNLRTQMWSEIKYGSATLRQNFPVFYSMCISHMNFSEKYIRTKSCFYLYILCHQCSTIVDKNLILFCLAYSMFSTCKILKITYIN